MRLTLELLEWLRSERIFDDVPSPLRTRPTPVRNPCGLPYLLSVEEAASVLLTSVPAVYARVARGQLSARHGLRRSGRKVQFLRDKLLGALETDEPRRGRR